MTKTYKRPIFHLRMVTIILGLITMCLGLHSHFESHWAKVEGLTEEEWYRYCEHEFYELDGKTKADLKCPSIALERFYISMVTIFFILSLLMLAVIFILEMDTYPLKYVDAVYHGIGAVFLFIGAILYLISAVQINNFSKRDDIIFYYEKMGWTKPDFKGATLRYGEKIAAGVITLLQALSYGIAAFFIARQ